MAELIVALDLESGAEALRMTQRLPGLRWAKVGPVLFVREGPPLVRELVARGIKVFLDLKWHDIPTTVAGAVRASRELGVGMATVHALGGSAMLEAAQQAAGDLPLVGVTVLTSHDRAAFERIVGAGVSDLGHEAERLARSAVSAGLRGVVASGLEVYALRRALGATPWIVVPGIRLAADGANDQARTVTPGEAQRMGATHLVVGRSITAAANPADAFERVRSQL
jgi:orotidine-5'-phosphate decarboxylase